MKTHALALSLLSAFSCFSQYVTEDDAKRAVSNWIAEGHAICGTSVSVVGCTVVSNSSGTVSSYAVKLSDGRYAMTSSDSSLDPILAVVKNPFDVHGAPVSGLPLWSFLGVTNRTALLSSGSSARIVKRRSWDQLLSGTRRSRPLSTPTVSYPAHYVLPGFDDGEKFTHWNQTTDNVARWALYNHCLRDVPSFGPNVHGGLKMNFNRMTEVPYSHNDDSAVPCGCTATAFAALMQYESVRGFTTNSVGEPLHVTRPNSYWYDGVSSWEDTDITGLYDVDPIAIDLDWWRLPVSHGGKYRPPNPYEFWTTSSSDYTRLVIGATAFNCGALVSMSYGWGASSAAPANFTISHTYPGSSVIGMAGFCESPVGATSSWSESVVDEWIRSGHPVVTTISKSDGSAHCVLSVGRDSDTGMTRIFLGWGGTGDGWYNTSSSVSIQGYTFMREFSRVTDRRSGTVPVFGRLVTSGYPVVGVPVYVSYGGSYAGVSITDDGGYFRMLYKPSAYGNLSEKIISLGTTVSERIRNVQIFTNETILSEIKYVHTVFESGNADVGQLSASSSNRMGFDAVAYNWQEADLVLDEKSKTFDPVFVFCGDGVSTVHPPSSVYSLYVVTNSAAGGVPGEYMVVDTRKYKGRTLFSSGDHVLSYGVSTNSEDIVEYARKAVEKLDADFQRRQ